MFELLRSLMNRNDYQPLNNEIDLQSIKAFFMAAKSGNYEAVQAIVEDQPEIIHKKYAGKNIFEHLVGYQMGVGTVADIDIQSDAPPILTNYNYPAVILYLLSKGLPTLTVQQAKAATDNCGYDFIFGHPHDADTSACLMLITSQATYPTEYPISDFDRNTLGYSEAAVENRVLFLVNAFLNDSSYELEDDSEHGSEVEPDDNIHIHYPITMDSRTMAG